MDKRDFTAEMPGSWVSNERGDLAYLPKMLPVSVALTPSLVSTLSEAALTFGRLQGAVNAVDDPGMRALLGPLQQREARISSLIEGTIADADQLALFEVDKTVEQRVPDVREVANYLNALQWGVAQLKERAISVNLIKQLHQRLLSGVRGEEDTPGEFRQCPVYIGKAGRPLHEARFVPPPHIHVESLLANLVSFLNENREFPALIRAAIAHYQFEAIHPFRDGNGRIGRLLITLQLVADERLDVPVLHLSPYFERQRSAYYDGLLGLSQTGNWHHWIQYFLEGIIDQSQDTTERVQKLRQLRRHYRDRFEQARGSALVLKVIDLLFQRPAVTISYVAEHLKITYPPAKKHIQRLHDAGFLTEVTGKGRDRIYVATQIIQIIQEG